MCIMKQHGATLRSRYYRLIVGTYKDAGVGKSKIPQFSILVGIL